MNGSVNVRLRGTRQCGVLIRWGPKEIRREAGRRRSQDVQLGQDDVQRRAAPCSRASRAAGRGRWDGTACRACAGHVLVLRAACSGRRQAHRLLARRLHDLCLRGAKGGGDHAVVEPGTAWRSAERYLCSQALPSQAAANPPADKPTLPAPSGGPTPPAHQPAGSASGGAEVQDLRVNGWAWGRGGRGGGAGGGCSVCSVGGWWAAAG